MSFIKSHAKKLLTLQLSRDLRRDIKRGHPWVFANNLRHCPPSVPGRVAMLLDNRKRELAHGFYSSDSPLAFRVCSVETSKPLNDTWAETQFERAYQLRQMLFDSQTKTTGFRLFNGEGDGLPGLVVDLYDDTAVLKLDGPAAVGFWDSRGIGRWLAERLSLRCVYERPRERGQAGQLLVGKLPPQPIQFLENGVRFGADIVNGQKTGFFLDQRDNRQMIRRLAGQKRVLNLFGYTGGFSIYSALGGASHVTTVDIAAPAIKSATENWRLNKLPDGSHEPVVRDVPRFVEQALKQKRLWDLIVVDPPSYAPSKGAVKKAINAYQNVIAGAAQLTTADGFLAASSCSSHISMEMFLSICQEAISKAKRRATVLSISGQPADHPTPLIFSEFRYLKFVLMRVE
ncbi:class I SAM-dependent rRNA methyltransferase [Anaerolineales bacterium HSG6]|nr:class I SAM-dependent rRNA methyltransferase [Anaerolineales bacterium HSG6]MDM8529817.1 class I SAM-dependent rRNA methyltransferase [Anaerolineales bacterium HSG25]